VPHPGLQDFPIELALIGDGLHSRNVFQRYQFAHQLKRALFQQIQRLVIGLDITENQQQLNFGNFNQHRVVGIAAQQIVACFAQLRLQQLADVALVFLQSQLQHGENQIESGREIGFIARDCVESTFQDLLGDVSVSGGSFLDEL